MDTTILKTCSKCGQSKTLTNFGKQSSTKDGHKYQCKQCDKSINKERYNNKHVQIGEQVKQWQSKNKEKLKTYQRKYKERKLSVN